MSKKTWSDAVATIRQLLGPATRDQLRLLDLLGLQVSKDIPRLIVAAKLRDHLAKDIALPAPSEPGAREIARINFLKQAHDGDINPRSHSEGEAWGDHLRLLRRVEHLECLKIEAGDIVEVPTEGRFAEISSIGEDGSTCKLTH